jgi:hypothetical protein
MFEGLEKLSKNGSVIFGNTNNVTSKFFAFFQPNNCFELTKGLLTDLELSEYCYVAHALDDCKCIPFGLGQTLEEAFNKIKIKYDKYFGECNNWISYDYHYFDFIRATSEIDGYIDFMCQKEKDFKLFNLLKKYENSSQKLINLVLEKYDEVQDLEQVHKYFYDELDIYVSEMMIIKIIDYNRE